MNLGNLKKLFDNYLENFDTINNEIHREYYKWEAVKHFQEHWDIDAPDFAGMFKEAVKLTSNLIDNKTVQPTNGIIKLAERSELTETVRSMFRDLYAEDDGNIDARQSRIQIFLAKADELLRTYEPGKWKYAQNMRTVIFYLALRYPAQNYMFKSEQAREFLYCAEYGDDFGRGENFSLKKYYAMCDELVSVIKLYDKLKDAHTSRLTSTMFEEDDFHILAYDIIYSGIVYNLYKNIKVIKPTTAKSVEKQRLIKINELTDELEQKVVDINALRQARSEYDTFSAKGLEVVHKKFGLGVVTEHNDCRITVQFAECKTKFQLPAGFTNGYLQIDSGEIMEIFTEMAELDQEIKALESAISELQQKIKVVR